MMKKDLVALLLWVLLCFGAEPSTAQTTCAEFKCSNGNCVKSSLQCNGWNDCGDGSDEYGCGICSSDIFRCQNGNCVKSIDVCNYGNDCGDNSDEFGCEHCSPIQFRCPYGNCINSSLICNGVNDCPYHDNSDERGCSHKGMDSTTVLVKASTADDIVPSSTVQDNGSGVFIAGIAAGIVGVLVIFTVLFILTITAYKHRRCSPKYHLLDPVLGDMRITHSAP